MNKKIKFSILTLGIMASPTLVVISCGSNEKTEQSLPIDENGISALKIAKLNQLILANYDSSKNLRSYNELLDEKNRLTALIGQAATKAVLNLIDFNQFNRLKSIYENSIANPSEPTNPTDISVLKTAKLNQLILANYDSSKNQTAYNELVSEQNRLTALIVQAATEYELNIIDFGEFNRLKSIYESSSAPQKPADISALKTVKLNQLYLAPYDAAKNRADYDRLVAEKERLVDLIRRATTEDELNSVDFNNFRTYKYAYVNSSVNPTDPTNPTKPESQWRYPKLDLLKNIPAYDPFKNKADYDRLIEEKRRLTSLIWDATNEDAVNKIDFSKFYALKHAYENSRAPIDILELKKNILIQLNLADYDSSKNRTFYDNLIAEKNRLIDLINKTTTKAALDQISLREFYILKTTYDRSSSRPIVNPEEVLAIKEALLGRIRIPDYVSSKKRGDYDKLVAEKNRLTTLIEQSTTEIELNAISLDQFQKLWTTYWKSFVPSTNPDDGDEASWREHEWMEKLPSGFVMPEIIRYLEFKSIRFFPDDVDFSKTKEIGKMAFTWVTPTLPENFKFSNNLVKIDEYAFAALKYFPQNFRLPDSLKVLGGFNNLEYLPSGFTLPPNLTELTMGAFSHLKSLPDSFKLPKTLKKIGKGAFFSLTSIPDGFKLPKGVELGESAFPPRILEQLKSR